MIDLIVLLAKFVLMTVAYLAGLALAMVLLPIWLPMLMWDKLNEKVPTGNGPRGMRHS